VEAERAAGGLGASAPVLRHWGIVGGPGARPAVFGAFVPPVAHAVPPAQLDPARAGPSGPSWLPDGLRALRHADYRLFFFSQLGSLTGTWLQSLAQSWLVLTLTNSPVQLGLIGVCQFGPSLLFGLPGGVLADRLPKRKLLIATQSVIFAVTAALAVVVLLGRVELWHIYAAALSIGTVNAVDMPTRQAFVSEMVGKDDLMNAVALNSALFNATRIIGPALAGVLLSTVGPALCFAINAVTFLPVIAALAVMRTEGAPRGSGAGATSAWHRLREGLRYVASTPAVLLPIVLVGFVATFGMNFNVWVPLLARDALDIGAAGFGILMASLGVGSLAGALTLAFVGRKPHRRAMLLTACLFGGLEIALAVAVVAGVPLAGVIALMAAVGFAMSTTMAMANTTVQTTAPDELRGRVMSVYTTVFFGSSPLGAAVAGGTAAVFGAAAALALGGSVALAAALGVAAWGRRGGPADRHARTASGSAPAPAARGR
jgi:MFS family permease